jgi:hypothetical protein
MPKNLKLKLLDKITLSFLSGINLFLVANSLSNLTFNLMPPNSKNLKTQTNFLHKFWRTIKHVLALICPLIIKNRLKLKGNEQTEKN